MRVDVFAHGLPVELRRAVLDRAPSIPDLVNWSSLPELFEADLRLRLMDRLNIDVQVLTTPSPPLETMFDAASSCKLAELANDGMAKLVREQPQRLRGVATLPLVDPEWAITELRRAVLDLGLTGPLVYTHVNGRPLDRPELEPFWSAVEELEVPVWLHPDRPSTTPDYAGEAESRYGMFLVLGWPYETSVAMARLVLSGVLARHPRLSILVHHGGAMIPFFHKRIEMNFQGGQGRVPALADETVDVDRDLRRFYVDTALQGATGALDAAIRFFGADHVLFATDAPFGPNGGLAFAEASLRSVNRLSSKTRDAIFAGNAIRLLSID